MARNRLLSAVILGCVQAFQREKTECEEAHQLFVLICEKNQWLNFYFASNREDN